MFKSGIRIASKEKTTFKATVVQGFGTLIVREFFLKLLSFVGQIFLARLLIPSDFGVYVIIVFIINLFALFSDIGLSLAIIQKKEEPTHLELSGVFWLKILLSLGIILLIWIIAPFIKVFYPAFVDSNVAMLRVFSVTLILTSLRIIPISLLERKIKYSLISLVDVMGVLVYYTIALGGALLNFGVWSFILGAIIKEIVETIVLNFIQPFLPLFNFSINNIRKMVKFGIYIQGNSLVMFFISSINPAIGGKLTGPYGVGLLDFAYNIVSIPATVSMNFARVAFAGYSRIQDNKDVILRSISKSISMLAIILYFFPVIILSFGGELVNFVYTDKWIAAVPSLYWFSAAVFFYPPITSLGQVILSIGKSKEIFWATFIIAFMGWASAYLLTFEFGFTGVAMANFLIYSVLCIAYIYILKKSEFKFDIIPMISSKLIVAILAIVFSFALNLLLPSNFAVLVIKLISCATAYFVLMLIFARNDTLEIFGLIKNLVRAKKI